MMRWETVKIVKVYVKNYEVRDEHQIFFRASPVNSKQEHVGSKQSRVRVPTASIIRMIPIHVHYSWSSQSIEIMSSLRIIMIGNACPLLSRDT